MTKLVYTEEELMRSHDYAKPHEVGGNRLHGGFDAEGRYVSPRALVRAAALDAWTEQLRARGGDWMEADSALLRGQRFPTVEQSRYLLREGLGQSFWNNLTITGMIEGRGRVLAEMQFPDFQDAVVEDISQMAIGHLHTGLLKAHGIDEGGEPDKGIGGHDVMWFALRDLAFGDTTFPQPEVPERIGREDDAKGEFSEIPQRYEQIVSFLLNLLMIEFRAEIGFAMTQEILRAPDVFTDRRAEAEEAAEVVERIRTDELIHVDSLRLYLGEMRSCQFKTVDGGTKPGHEIVDTFWQRVVHWATVEQPKLMAEQQRKLYADRILAHADGERILKEFEALGEG